MSHSLVSREDPFVLERRGGAATERKLTGWRSPGSPLEQGPGRRETGQGPSREPGLPDPRHQMEVPAGRDRPDRPGRRDDGLRRGAHPVQPALGPARGDRPRPEAIPPRPHRAGVASRAGERSNGPLPLRRDRHLSRSSQRKKRPGPPEGCLQACLRKRAVTAQGICLTPVSLDTPREGPIYSLRSNGAGITQW